MSKGKNAWIGLETVRKQKLSANKATKRSKGT